MKNAKLLNINLDEVDTIVLSHGHWDHGNGLKQIEGRKTIILHPDSFTDRYSVSRNMQYAGLNQKLDEMSARFDVVQSRESYMISESVYYLGQIPRTVDFEGDGNLSTVLDPQTEEKDLTLDDSGIVIKIENGIVVVSGCAHAGICNTIEHAKQVAKEDRVLAVVGGFHLRKVNDKVMRTMQYFIDNKIQTLYMGHCNADEVIEEFEKQLKGKCKIMRLYSGAEFEIKGKEEQEIDR